MTSTGTFREISRLKRQTEGSKSTETLIEGQVVQEELSADA
jgi:hypothetical protein